MSAGYEENYFLVVGFSLAPTKFPCGTDSRKVDKTELVGVSLANTFGPIKNYPDLGIIACYLTLLRGKLINVHETQNVKPHILISNSMYLFE